MRMFGWGDSVPKESEQSRDASFSGYLWKMKREKKAVVPQWSKRWFSIEGRYLRWYSHANSESASGHIEFEQITGVCRFESGGGGVYSFLIYHPDRNLLLRASSGGEMKMWLRAIQMQADLAKGGDGMGILCKPNPSDGVARQRKMRSSTLESELNRKLVELDRLEKGLVKGDDHSRPGSRCEGLSRPNKNASNPCSKSVKKKSDWEVDCIEDQSYTEEKDTSDALSISSSFVPKPDNCSKPAPAYEPENSSRNNSRRRAHTPVLEEPLREEDEAADVRIRRPANQGNASRSNGAGRHQQRSQFSEPKATTVVDNKSSRNAWL